MEKFKEKNLVIYYLKLFVLIIIVICLLYFCIYRLNNISKKETVIDINLLNTLQSDNKLKESIFIKDNNLEEYNNYINSLINETFPKDIASLIYNSNKYTYIFNDSYLLIKYTVIDENITYDNLYLPVIYNNIKDFIKFEYDENITAVINETNKKFDYAVSLTFDDGPNGNKTLSILDYLEDYNYSSTFFMVGNKLNNAKDIVKKVYYSDNEVGYHSYKHAYFTKQTNSEMINDLALSNKILYGIVNDYFKLTRPPYGSYNDNSLNAINMPFIRWSIDTNDWKYRDSDYIFNYVKDNIFPGAIILMHDSYESSAEAVPRILKYCYLNNIEVLSVSKLADKYNVSLESNESYYKFG